MLRPSNLYSPKKLSRLFIAITLVISLFSGTGYFNTSLIPKAQVPQTTLVLTACQQDKKTIKLYNVLINSIKTFHFCALSQHKYLISFHNRKAKIQFTYFEKPLFCFAQTSYLSFIKTFPASTDEDFPLSLQG